MRVSTPSHRNCRYPQISAINMADFTTVRTTLVVLLPRPEISVIRWDGTGIFRAALARTLLLPMVVMATSFAPRDRARTAWTPARVVVFRVPRVQF
jgi:hypothetical protein